MDKRVEILNSAKRSFETFGYKATTIDQVAKMTKVGKGTVYNFFSSKEELLEEVVLIMVNQMIEETEAMVDPSISFVENAQNTLENLLKYRQNHVLFIKLIEEEKSLQTRQVMLMLEKIETAILSYFASKLDLAIQKGELRPCDTKFVSYLILKAYLAFVVDWPTKHNEELNEKQITSLIQETIIRGLLV